MPGLAGMRALGARGRISPLVVVTCQVDLPILRSHSRLSVDESTVSKSMPSANWYRLPAMSGKVCDSTDRCALTCSNVPHDTQRAVFSSVRKVS